jgi:hypothetical protein
MRSAVGTGSFELALDRTRRVWPGRGGVILRAERGVLHVTQAGDPEDHVLEAGAELRLPSRGLVVVHALAAGRLEVREAPAPVAAGAGRRARGPALAS